MLALHYFYLIAMVLLFMIAKMIMLEVHLHNLIAVHQNVILQKGEGLCGSPKYVDGNYFSISPDACGGGCLSMNSLEADVNCSEKYNTNNWAHYWWCTPIDTVPTSVNYQWLANNLYPVNFNGNEIDCPISTGKVSHDNIIGFGLCCDQGN